MGGYINVYRNGEDASKVASEAAKKAGTKISGNMRWETQGSVRCVPTLDGRVVRIYENRPN